MDRRPSRLAGRIIPLDGERDRRRKAPPLPADYDPSVRRAWRDFWRSPVAQAADRAADLPALLMWAHALNEWQRVVPVVQETPTVEGSQGQPVLNPLVSYLRHLAETIHHYELHFGMTPRARAQLGLTIGAAKLTAQELNRRLGVKPATTTPAAWEEEWEAE